MCRAALAGEQGQSLAEAFRSGILFLLAAPFLVFVAVAAMALRAQREWQASGKNDQQDDPAL